MQNNAAVLPAQSDADVACTRTRIWAGTNDVEQMVKLRHIYHSVPDGYFASAATRVKKRPISSDINVVCMVLTFSGEAVGTYDTRNACSDKGKMSIFLDALFAWLLYAVILIAITVESLVDSCRSPADSARMKAKLMIKRRYISLQRKLFLCLISPVTAV